MLPSSITLITNECIFFLMCTSYSTKKLKINFLFSNIDFCVVPSVFNYKCFSVLYSPTKFIGCGVHNRKSESRHC